MRYETQAYKQEHTNVTDQPPPVKHISLTIRKIYSHQDTNREIKKQSWRATVWEKIADKDYPNT